MLRESLAKKQEHDRNFLLRVVADIGELAKEIRDLKGRMLTLERKIKREDNKTN